MPALTIPWPEARKLSQMGITLIGSYVHCYMFTTRCEASWGEPERDMTVSTRLSDSVFTETHRLENALKSEDK